MKKWKKLTKLKEILKICNIRGKTSLMYMQDENYKELLSPHANK
jgi:hypothetical protein